MNPVSNIEGEREFFMLKKANEVKGSANNRQGFGRISKFVMCDITLSYEAKVLYSLLINYAGKGNSAYPTLKTLVQNLGTGKSKLHTAMWELINQGYIKKGKMKSYGNFERNIYEIVACPPKYESKPEDSKDAYAYEKIRNGGIQSYCYGIVPQFAMTDSKLNIKAKSIYAYLCAYAGNTNTAYPTEKAICYHLKMSENTYRKYFRELVTTGYVMVIRHRDGGKFSQSEYVLIGHPNAKVKSNYNANMALRNEASQNSVPLNLYAPPPKNDTIVQMFDPDKKTIKSSATPAPKDRNTAGIKHAATTLTSPPVKPPSTKSPPPKDKDTNTNSKKTNKVNTNIPTAPISIPEFINQNKKNKNKFSTSVNQSELALNPKSAKNKKATGLIDHQKNKNFIRQDLFDRNAINPEFLKDKSTARIVVDILSAGTKAYTSDYWHKMILSCLSQMLYNSGNSENQKYNPVKVANMINTHIKTFSYDNTVFFDSWLEDFEKSFDKSVRRREVSENIIQPYPYVKRSIWDFLVHYISQKEKLGVPGKVSSFNIDDFFKKAHNKSMNYCNTSINDNVIDNFEEIDSFIDFA